MAAEMVKYEAARSRQLPEVVLGGLLRAIRSGLITHLRLLGLWQGVWQQLVDQFVPGPTFSFMDGEPSRDQLLEATIGAAIEHDLAMTTIATAMGALDLEITPQLEIHLSTVVTAVMVMRSMGVSDELIRNAWPRLTFGAAASNHTAWAVALGLLLPPVPPE